MDQTFKPSRASVRADIIDGVQRGLPLVLAGAPFGLLFGALAVDNGLSLAETVFMSAVIYAGASQMVGLDLFGQNVAPWTIVMSIFAVNFRNVLYSASTGRRIRHFKPWQKVLAFFVLVDIQYAEVEQRAEAGRPVTFVWYMSLGLTFYVTWVLEALIGGLFGNLIPDPYAFGIDFLLPIYFLGMVMSFRHRQNWLPIVIVSAISAVAAYKFVGSPWHVTLGALGGVALAAIIAKPREGEA